MFARLIDWGLTAEYIPNSSFKLPNVWFNRPIQYNMPYSNILFSDLFNETYSHFLENAKIFPPNLEEIMSFVKKFCSDYFKSIGRGHIFLINKIINIITDEKLNKESVEITNSSSNISTNTEFVIIRYLSGILLDYTSTGNYREIRLDEYLNEIFIHNIDKWGFVMSYYPFLESFYQNYLIIDDSQKEIYNSLCEMFKYVINMDTEIIETSTIIAYLKDLDNFNSPKKITPTNTISIIPTSSSKGITGKSWEPDIDILKI